MKVEKLESGEPGQYEDFNSFKVFTVHSEPGIKQKPDSGPVGVHIEEEKEERSKRLATAVEFSVHRGDTFLWKVRSQTLNGWKVYSILREEGWGGIRLQNPLDKSEPLSYIKDFSTKNWISKL